ncbi:MAG: hypothetical protein QM756_15065 [Polyangiaceae bacterium]
MTEAVPSAEKSTTIKASVGSTDKISARWHAKTGSKPEMQLLANVTAATLISVEDGLLHTDTWLQYEVPRGQMEKIRLAIPKGKRVLDVTADAKIKEWSTADEAERQVVTVEFLSRLTGKTTVEVHLESDLPADGFDVAGLTGETTGHGVHALDVVRESGQIAVLPSGDLSLTVELQQAVQRLAEGDVDSRIRRRHSVFQILQPQSPFAVAGEASRAAAHGEACGPRGHRRGSVAHQRLFSISNRSCRRV